MENALVPLTIGHSLKAFETCRALVYSGIHGMALKKIEERNTRNSCDDASKGFNQTFPLSSLLHQIAKL